MNAAPPPSALARELVDFGGRRSGGGALAALPCAVAALVIVVIGSRLTFFNDDWAFVLNRPDLSAHSVLEPANGHLVALTVVVYRVIISLSGLSSQVPFRIALALAYIALGTGVFVFVRARVGILAATVATTLVLLLGPAWEDFFWDVQISFVSAMAAGVWALVLLERRTRRADAGATVLLVVAVCFSNVGLTFLPAAALVALVRRRRKDLWIVAVPVFVFAAWWLAYGRDAESYLSVKNLLRLPEYVADSAAAGLASLSGLGGGLLTAYGWGPTLLGLVAVGAGVWVYLRRPPLHWLPVAAAPALTFWVLTGLTFTEGREPIASRYQLISATLIVMILAELFRTARPSAAALIALAVAGAVMLAPNLYILKAQGYDSFRKNAAFAKAELGALEIMRGNVGPDFRLVPAIAQADHLSQVTAGAYFRETDAHGKLGYSEREIGRATPEVRHAVDTVFVAGYALGLKPADRHAYSAGKDCAPLGQEADLSVVLGSGVTARLANKRRVPASVSLSRFAPRGTAVALTTIPPRAVVTLTLPRDRAATLWRVYSTTRLTIGRC